MLTLATKPRNAAATFILLALSCATALAAGEARKSILVEGSSGAAGFFNHVSRPWANKNHVSVSVSARGSKAAQECVAARTCDIGLSSLDLTAQEKEKIAPILFGYDGVAVVASMDVPVESLTAEQVRQVFLGRVTNWKEVGGPDARIEAYQRRKEGGIHDIFNKMFDVDPKLPVFGTNPEVQNRLKFGHNMISYTAIAPASVESGKSLKILKIDGVAATPENVRDGKYKYKYAYHLLRSRDSKDDPVLNAYVEHLLKSRAENEGIFGMIVP